MFNGLVPKSVVFGLVRSDAFNGAYKRNPFNLQHFGLSFFSMSVNGEEVPFKPLQLSFDVNNPQFIEAYMTLFSGTGKMNFNSGNDIARSEYPTGYTLVALDLTADMCGSSDHFNAVQRGNLALDLKFATAPTVAVSLICYGEFENTIQIDSERNVIYDYSG